MPFDLCYFPFGNPKSQNILRTPSIIYISLPIGVQDRGCGWQGALYPPPKKKKKIADVRFWAKFGQISCKLGGNSGQTWSKFGQIRGVFPPLVFFSSSAGGDSGKPDQKCMSPPKKKMDWSRTLMSLPIRRDRVVVTKSLFHAIILYPFPHLQVNNYNFHDPDFYPIEEIARSHHLYSPQLNHVSFKFASAPPLSQPHRRHA